MANSPSMSQPESRLSKDVLRTGEDPAEEADVEMLMAQVLEDPGVTQYVIRRVDELDTLVGYYRCEFQPGQQRFALHVPLYPAMSQAPDVEAFVVECESTRVRITDCQPFGLRLEVVLPKPVEKTSRFLVEVVATAQP